MVTLDLTRVSAEAREIRFGRVFLTALAALFYGVGWTTRKVLGGLWLAVAWSWTAVRLGWQEAAPKPSRTP
jgi:hypothetical protein